MDCREVELKLGLPPAALKRVLSLPTIASAAAAPPSRSRWLRATYYDTPDFLLRRSGIAARLRQDGQQWRQTVKTDGQRSGGLFQRQEWECSVASPQPDWEHLRACGLAPLADDAVLAALRPVFQTEIRRRTLLLAGDGWCCELALDHGAIAAADQRLEVCELELELRQGSAAALFALAQSLAEALPVRVLHLSKSDRGYRLAQGGGAAAGPVKASPTPLTPDMSAAQAFQVIARTCLAHLQANEACLLETGAPEAIHQMRVALRRLRSAFRLFRRLVDSPGLDQLRQDIRHLLARLGPARDGHVFIEEIITPAALPGTPLLRGLWQDRQHLHHREAVEAVQARDFPRLLMRLAAWIEDGEWTDGGEKHRQRLNRPVAVFAAKSLDKSAARMLRAARDGLERLEPDALHQLRILGKQLRYAGEFFAPLYPRKSVAPYLASLTQLQDALGQLNDIAVALPRLADPTLPPDLAEIARQTADWHRKRQKGLRQDAAKAWTHLTRARPFWR